MQGFTLICVLIIPIVQVTSSEFLKRLRDHPTNYPCNIIKCPGNKVCILEVKNKTCSECTVSPLCISLEYLPASKCPVGFPIVYTKPNNVVPFRCNNDGDCPSGSFCFGKGIYGVCCSGSYSIGRPFHTQFKHISNDNALNMRQNREFMPRDPGHNLLNLLDIILKTSFQNSSMMPTGDSVVDFKASLGKTSNHFYTNFTRKAGKNSTYQQKPLIDFKARANIKRKHTVYFKQRDRRSPNGYYDSLHPSEQGLEVPLTKPGKCSTIRLGKWSSGCMDTCFNDVDCYSNLKCCYNGCARSCQYPLATYNPDIPSKRPGRCPRLSSIGLSQCTGRSCTMDTDCPADDICCNSGDCGRICQHPIPNNLYW